MKTFKRIIPAAVLSFMLVFGMAAASPYPAYADSDGTAANISAAAQIADASDKFSVAGEMQVRSGRTSITITEANDTIQNSGVFKKYELTPDSETNRKYECSAYMPVAGTLIIVAGSDQGASYSVNASGQGVTYADYDKLDNSTSYAYNVSTPGTVNIDVTVYESGRSAWVGGFYAAADISVSANTPEFVLGSAGSGAESTFNVSVPATGYLSVTAINIQNTGGSVQFKTGGFKAWDYRIGGAPLKIGVKKGTYTISVKGAKYYGLSVKFTKVKETSAKTSKNKAAKIKKGKANKGIIAVNSKKVHWYKIKNPKNQKINFDFNASNMSAGGSGYVMITAYFPRGSKKSATVRPGETGKFYLTSGTIGTKKAVKGTYYLKVESKGGANGYYTLKWK